MFKHSINMELIRNVARWGNSAGILLPKEWLGNQVKIILIDRTLEIKKEVLSMLSDYLEDILGIYITGSYARGEQEKDSDIDIVAISKNTKKEIISGKYHISIITLEGAKKTLESNPILILPRLREARVILNNSLLSELVSTKINKNSFKSFLEESRRIMKINRGFIDIDKEQGFEYLDSINIIYSLILRLRGMFMIKCFLGDKKYSKKEFLKFIHINEAEKYYNIYKFIRDGKKIKEKIKIKTAEDLLEILKREVKKYEKKEEA